MERGGKPFFVDGKIVVQNRRPNKGPQKQRAYNQRQIHTRTLPLSAFLPRNTAFAAKQEHFTTQPLLLQAHYYFLLHFIRRCAIIENRC